MLIKREATCQSKRSFGAQRKILTHPALPPLHPPFPFPILSPFSRAVADNFCERARKILVGESLFTNGPQGEYDSPGFETGYIRAGYIGRKSVLVRGVKDARDHVMSMRAFMNIEAGSVAF